MKTLEQVREEIADILIKNFETAIYKGQKMSGVWRPVQIYLHGADAILAIQVGKRENGQCSSFCPRKPRGCICDNCENRKQKCVVTTNGKIISQPVTLADLIRETLVSPASYEEAQRITELLKLFMGGNKHEQ